MHAADPPDGRLPLRLGMCASCGLAQLADPSPPEADEPDAPSPLSSATMTAHARAFVDDLVARGLATPAQRILSLASHGGHLAPFLRERGLSATIIEGSPARAARLAASGTPVVAGGLNDPKPPAGLAAGSLDLAVDSYLLAHLARPLLDGPSYTVASLRNATAYGVSPRLRCDVVLNNLVAWAHTTGAVRLKSDGTPWRPIVHVRDIAQAFLLALAAPREVVGGRAFNVVATAENYQVRDLARIVADTLPGCTVEIAPDASPDVRNYRVRGDRFAAAVGFEAAWDARRGAAELAAAFRETGLTFDEVEGPRFQRIARIRERLADGSLRPDLRFRPGVAPEP